MEEDNEHQIETSEYEENHSEPDLSSQQHENPDTDEESFLEEEDRQLSASQIEVPVLQPSKSLKDLEELDDSVPIAIFEEVQKSLKSLSSDSSPETQKMAEKLILDYDKLKSIVLESRNQTRNIAKRANQLSMDLIESSSKVQSIVKATQSDRNQVTSLKKELKKAWKTVETNKEKEAKAKEVISSLKSEIISLRSSNTDQQNNSDDIVISQASNLGKNKLLMLQIEQEDQLKKLTKAKVETDSELLKCQNEIKSYKVELEEMAKRIENMTKERNFVEDEMVALKEYLAAKKSEHDREIRSKEKIETNLRQAQEALEKRENELRSKIDEIKALKESLNKAETQLQSEQARSEKMTTERDVIYSQQVRLQQDYDEQIHLKEQLMNQNHEQTRKLKAWDEEISRLRENYKSVVKAKLALTKKYKALDEIKVAAELERDSLRSVNSHLMHDLETTKKEFEQASKTIDLVTRERDISQKNFVKSTSASMKQYSMLKLSEQNKRNLEQEISGYKDEAQKMRKLIFTLEKERDNRLNDMTKFQQLVIAKDEEIKMKDIIIFDSKKKITDFEKKLKEQQALYENVRTDRNVYSKNLLESQDEILELKRKLKIMNHQVEQLKEEISSRESILVKEHFEHTKLEKEKEGLLLQIGKLQKQYDEAHRVIQNQENEESKLRHIIAEADMERIRQTKEYDSVVQERDILGTHLIRRNDELSLLYEKIKIQTSTLNKGEIQYRERLEDIRVLRLEIKKLRREKAMLQTETQNVDNLKNEVFRLQRDILRERTRVKVLEEELESPMNIHRWRKLSGSDPSTFELISKIQTLQKRLITKTEEVVEKELVIQQKEKLYNDIKKVLQRQPGPEIMEDLQVVRTSLKSKIRESKALASELNMYHSQVNEYKYEIERLNRELQELKSKYYELRKKRNSGKAIENQFLGYENQMTPMDIAKIDTRSNTSYNLIKPNPVNGPRFSGGGFNMSAFAGKTEKEKELLNATT